MKKWILTSLTCILLAVCTNVFAKTNPDFKTAQSIIQNWFAAIKENQINKAASFLAPQFTSIHTDGMVRNKAQEIELIKNLHMKDYNLTNFKFIQSADAIIVTYKDKGSEQIDNKPIGPEAAGRMAVLQKQGKKWLILAYANLDQI